MANQHHVALFFATLITLSCVGLVRAQGPAAAPPPTVASACVEIVPPTAKIHTDYSVQQISQEAVYYLTVPVGRDPNSFMPVPVTVNSPNSAATYVIRHYHIVGGKPVLVNVFHPDKAGSNSDGSFEYLYFDPSKQSVSSGDTFDLWVQVRPNEPLMPNRSASFNCYDTLSSPAPDATAVFGTKSVFYVGYNSRTFTNLPPRQYSFTESIQPAFHQSIIGGRTITAVHFPLTYNVPVLFPGNSSANFYLNSSNLISTDNRDTSTQLQVMLGAARQTKVGPDSPVVYELWREQVAYTENQAFNNSGLSLSAADAVLPKGFDRLRIGNAVRAPYLPLVQFIPVIYEHRFQRNTVLFPSHTETDPVTSSLSFGWDPIFLGSRQSVPDAYKDPSLTLTGQVWYFYNPESASGTRTYHFEGQYGIALRFPSARIQLSISAGANPANDYAHSTTYAVTYFLFGDGIPLLNKTQNQ